MPADDYRIEVRADKMRIGQHVRQYNALTIHKVAIAIVGEEFDSRDIILNPRNGDVHQVIQNNYFKSVI